MKPRILLFAALCLSLAGGALSLTACKEEELHINDGGVCTVCGKTVQANDESLFSFELLGDGTYGIRAADTAELPERLSLPWEHDGKPVTAVLPYAFMTKLSVREVILPSSITSIGEFAFWGDEGLSAVSFGSGMREIGASAFAVCSIGSFFVDKDNEAFCEKQGVLLSKDGTALVLGTADGIVPDGVTHIKEEAFSGNQKISAVTLPDTLVSVGREAFGNSSLSGTLVLPDSVTQMGRGAFQYTAIQELSIGSGLEAIPMDVFLGCNMIQHVGIPDTVTFLGAGAFSSCTALKSVVLGRGLTRTGAAFSNCPELTTITLPDTLRSIDNGCFNHCSSLSEINFPDGLASIGEDAFSGCAFSEVILPDSVTQVGAHAFAACSALERVSLSENLTELGDHAFESCSLLQ